MIFTLAARYTLTDLPKVGDRVIYATSNGAKMVGAGEVIQAPIMHLCSEGKRYLIPVRLDGEERHRNLWHTSLYREDLCK